VNRRGRTRAVQIFGALFFFVLAATLLTSFTASVNVPASKAGTSHQTLTMAELTPSECSSLSLSTVEKVSGSYSNNKSHVLILGSSGSDIVNDTGSSNCIALGGGSNSVTGTSSDICIKGPGGGSTYRGCTQVT
jgi:hypothetical protein